MSTSTFSGPELASVRASHLPAPGSPAAAASDVATPYSLILGIGAGILQALPQFGSLLTALFRFVCQIHVSAWERLFTTYYDCPFQFQKTPKRNPMCRCATRMHILTSAVSLN